MKASRAPPTINPTAFDEYPSRFDLSMGLFDCFKRVVNEFSDAELMPQLKSISRWTGISVVKPRVVHFGRVPGKSVDHFEWLVLKFTAAPRLKLRKFAVFDFIHFIFNYLWLLTWAFRVEKHKSNNFGLVANQLFSPNQRENSSYSVSKHLSFASMKCYKSIFLWNKHKKIG